MPLFIIKDFVNNFKIMCANILGEKLISLKSKRFIEMLVTKRDTGMMGLKTTADLDNNSVRRNARPGHNVAKITLKL